MARDCGMLGLLMKAVISAQTKNRKKEGTKGKTSLKSVLLYNITIIGERNLRTRVPPEKRFWF